MLKTILIFSMPFYVILFLTGCTANLTEPEIDFEPPAYVEQMPSREDKKDYISTGSIFGQGDNPLFSDHKAMHVNDIVRVVISETAQSSSTGTKALAESDESALGGGVFASAGGNPAMSAYASNLTGLSNIGYTGKSSNTYSGQGSATKDATFTTTVSARIVKVLQNGNYFISGKREILVDEQKQTIQISGVIRPYDIDQYNKISSAQMSDAKILYKTQGDLDRATKQGWGTKVIQAVWPF
ncbi:flagellar basal body L-ring protein FlgH [Sulfurimonas sp.]|uniref:flagellar basal body L-ring protein FlgH n=1 Tax=Sulfurimonas sp. TaxID=2022749 RepID=UPI002AB13657|nr:flagellar basal body L-ring protein FlgH [Sulfurimonas sp.]